MKLKLIIAASAALLSATAVQAQSAGSFILNAGWTNVTTQKSTLHEAEGFSADIKSKNTSAFGLSGTYFITDNIAGELALSTPARIDLESKAEKMGSVEQFSPTLLLKYYFLNAEDKFRPYVGVGVSHVSFRNIRGEKDDNGLDASFEFKNKWAPVANAGFTYQLTDRLFTGVSVSYMPLKSGVAAKTKHGESGDSDQVMRTTDSLKLNPITTFVSIGYKF